MQSTHQWARPVHRAWSLALRFQKFLVVGATGLLVNQILLYLLVTYEQMSLAFASPVAIIASMAVTFVLNEIWTWSDRGQGRWLQRAVLYGVINSGGLLINAGFLLFFTGHGMHFLLANLIGAGLAAIWNFVLNNSITWRR